MAALNLTGGVAALAAGHDKVLVLNTLTATGGGALDLTDNDLIAAAMTPAGFAALLQSGYASGAWNGVGITSSLAAADGKTIGYAQASDIFSSFPATIDGQSIASSAMIARWTIPGDVNLDGVVNAVDFNTLAANFNSATNAFDKGDLNYDGHVNAADFGALAANYGSTVPALSQSAPAAGFSVLAKLSAPAPSDPANSTFDWLSKDKSSELVKVVL